MAPCLIEMVLKEKDAEALRDLLKEHTVLEHRQLRCSDGEVLVRILLDAEQNEAVLDLLEKPFTGDEGSRVVILPVEATLPSVPWQRWRFHLQQNAHAQLDILPASCLRPSGRMQRGMDDWHQLASVIPLPESRRLARIYRKVAPKIGGTLYVRPKTI